MNDISSILQSIRKGTGLTQNDFANRIGLKQNTYSMLENGKNKPKLETIKSIIKEFDIDANVFFNEYKSVIDDTVKSIKEQLRDSRKNIIKNDIEYVDAMHSRKLYDLLNQRYPDLYNLKINFDTLQSFNEALAEIDNELGEKLRAAFWRYPGKFNFKDYELRAIKILEGLMPYEKPIAELSNAISKFYESMKSIDGNTIDFDEYVI